MRETLKMALWACSYLFTFFALGIVLAAASSLLKWVFKKQKPNLKDWNPLEWFRYAFAPERTEVETITLGIVIPVALIAGGINYALAEFCSKPEIGAFYEQGQYQQDYAATLDVGGNSIFCIATVEKYEGYYIVKVKLPYGKSDYTDGEYDTDTNKARVYLGDYGVDCEVALDHVATASDYKFLQDYAITNYGDFCASKDSNIYHLSDCQYVKQIAPQNLIYFHNQAEADALGFEICEICLNRIW